MPLLMTSPVYASEDDLGMCGAPPEALKKIGPEERQRALYQASRFADTRIAARYPMPLVSWGDDLTQIVCVIASFRLICFRGWNPADPANAGFVMMYNEAVKTLNMVAQGLATLNLPETSPGPVATPDITSDKPRGL